MAGASNAADENGEEVLEEIEILDSDFLIRKIPESHIHPRSGGGRRISKSAYSPSSGRVDPSKGMSANCERLLLAEGIAAADFAPEFPALGRLSVAELRQLNLEVVHRPRKGDKSHCDVLNVTSGLRDTLLKKAEVIRKPSDVV
jgi:hypothetical protein